MSMLWSSCMAWFAKRRWPIIVVIGVLMTAGFAVRYYHFEEWLYFKMDQSRDAALIGNAVLNGPASLPLLGPRAGATTLQHGLLRTGPAYYYMQYLSGVLSHSVEPYVFAYPDLFFGVLALPMLFLLSRLYFSRSIAFGITTLYTFCYLVIEYSRFAWNPNTLPFFIFLAFYGLLRFLNEPNVKRRYLWLVLWIFGLTIGSQLHFFGVFSLIGTSGLMVLWHFRVWHKEAWRVFFTKQTLFSVAKYISTGLTVVLLLYAPVIASDVVKKGENFHNFFEAMGSKPDPKPLGEKLNEGWYQNVRYYCTITTGACLSDGAKKNRWPMVATGTFLVMGLGVSAWRLRRLPNGIRQDFLRLVIVWTAVFFVLSIPVAFQLRPRFFLVVMAIPFITWGIFAEFAWERLRFWGVGGALLVFGGIFFLNVQATRAWFKEQSQSQIKDTVVTRTIILKNKDGVTLGQLQRAADFMYRRLQTGNRLYFYVKPEHVSPLNYLFRLKQYTDPGLMYDSMSFNEDPHAQFFVVVPDGKDPFQPVMKKFNQPFTVLSSEHVGQLLVAEIEFANRPVSQTFRFKVGRSNADRVFLGDILGIQKKENAVGIDNQE